MLADKYLAIEKNKSSKMLIECKRIYVHIDKLFAAALIKDNEAVIQNRLTSWVHCRGMPMRS